MPRGRKSRPVQAVALPTLTALALAAGFLFAGTGLEAEPPLAARDQAAQATAVRIALDPHASAPDMARRAAAPEPATRQPLIAGAETVRVSRYATRVKIASVGIDADVRTVGYVFNDGALQYDVPRRGAGQYAGSAAPGEVGNSVIAGHVSTRSRVGVFRELPNVRIGDTIEVSRDEVVYRYAVTEIRVVDPSETAAMAATRDSRLTLITCSPDRTAEERYIVVGQLL